MAIHELTTNAVKHGALASHVGRVAVTWRLQEGEGGDTTVQFCWRERCPSIDTDSGRTGYGSGLLEAAFNRTLEGNSQLTLHSDGAEFFADFRLPRKGEAESPEPGQPWE